MNSINIDIKVKGKFRISGSTAGISSRHSWRSAECPGWPVNIYKHLIVIGLQTIARRFVVRYV